MAAKHLVIWSDRDLDLKDWKDGLLEEAELNGETLDPDDEDTLTERMYELNAEYLGDERMNLGNIQYDQPIIAFAILGLWYGHPSKAKIIEDGKVSSCLRKFCRSESSMEFYVDGNGNFRANEAHHDGVNTYLFRVLKEGISEGRLDTLRDKIYAGEATEKDVFAITKPIGPDIAKVYGWSVRGATA